MKLKTCRRCKLEKPRSEFTKCPLASDGLRYWCKECEKSYAREYNNRPERKEYNRKHRELLTARGYWKEHEKEYLQRPGKREQRNEAKRLYMQRPEVRIKNFARWYTNHQIEKGNLKREPCAFCGAEYGEAHHLDYNQPLLVVWLCSNCHREVHLKEGGKEAE